jgi:ABC-type uncharacterized transport system permease subunit
MATSGDGGGQAGGAWGSPGPPGPPVPVGPSGVRGPGAGDAVAVGHLVAPAVTLALGWIVAVAVYFSAGDVPDGLLGDRVVPLGLILAAVAAPVALLVAWGEVDLSAFGVFPFAGYVYAELSDSGVLVGLLAAAGAGLAIGAGIGLVRWVTRAPSALASLAAAFVLQAVTLESVGRPDMRVLEEGFVDGWGIPLLAALGFTSLTAAAAAALGRDPGGRVAGVPGPEVIAGFGLSGAAAATYGALATGMSQVVDLSGGTTVLLAVFCAVAIGGVVRGNRLVGPIAAAIGALAAQLLIAGALVRGWEQSGRQLLVACVLAACLLVSHTLHRALGSGPGTADRPGRTHPPAPIGSPLGGAPPPAAWPPPRPGGPAPPG